MTITFNPNFGPLRPTTPRTPMSTGPKFAGRRYDSEYTHMENAVIPFREMHGEDETGELAKLFSDPAEWKKFQQECMQPYKFQPVRCMANGIPQDGIVAAVLSRHNHPDLDWDYKKKNQTSDESIATTRQINRVYDGYNNIIKVLGQQHNLSPLDLRDVGVVFSLLPAGKRLSRVTESPDKKFLVFEVADDPDRTKVSWHLMSFPLYKMNGSAGRGELPSREDGTSAYYVAQGQLTKMQRLSRAFQAFNAMYRRQQPAAYDMEELNK
jgi:hypothetical protein